MFVYLLIVYDLKNIIDFIYNGEAKIDAQDISRFLEAAKELQIKGLASAEVTVDCETEKETKNKDISPTMKNEEPVLIKLEEQETDEQKMNNTSNEYIIDCFSDEQNTVMQVGDESLKEHSEEISKNLERVLDSSSGYKFWRCKICGKTNKKKYRMMCHIQVHLNNFRFKCEFCDKSTKTRPALKAHVIIKHTKTNNKPAAQNEGDTLLMSDDTFVE